MHFSSTQAFCLIALLLWPAAIFGRPNSYQITPDKVTMLVGESRAFRMVDETGQAQLKVTWTLSNVDAFDSLQGDELHISARHAGEYRLTARTDFAVAEATVKVVDGSTLPAGTVKWASGRKEGCQTVKILQAVLRPNGPAYFEQTRCQDGEYLAGYTADGVQLWRRKISENGLTNESTSSGNRYEDMGQHLDTKLASFCDSVAAGASQKEIRDLLLQRNLTYHEQPNAGRVWLVEEPSTQCNLSFDEKLILVKKKKVFVVE